MDEKSETILEKYQDLEEEENIPSEMMDDLIRSSTVIKSLNDDVNDITERQDANFAALQEMKNTLKDMEKRNEDHVKSTSNLVNNLCNAYVAVDAKCNTLEKKCEILRDLFHKTREELKVSQAKIENLESLYVDGPPTLITIASPSQQHDVTSSSAPASSGEDQWNDDNYNDSGCEITDMFSTSSDSEPECLPGTELDNNFSSPSLELQQEIKRLSSKLQDYTDSIEEKTLIISKLNISPKIAKLNHHCWDFWPKITELLRARGLDFLLVGAADIFLYKRGTLKIQYDNKFRLRKNIQELRWMRRNIATVAHTDFQYRIIKKMCFSQFTRSELNSQRQMLQKIGSKFKQHGRWSSFDFVRRILGGERTLLIRGSRNGKSDFEYFDSNEKQFHF